MKQQSTTFLRTRATGLLTVLLLTGTTYVHAQNDECTGAATLIPSATTVCTSPVTGTTSGATTSSTVPSCGSTPGNDVWYSFVAAGTSCQISVSNLSGTNTLATTYVYGFAAYSGSCGSLTEAGCATGYYSIPFGDNPALPLVLNGLTAGNTYYVQVWSDEAYDDNFDPTTNDINFDICATAPPPPPPNDLCSGALVLAEGVAISGDNTSASDDALTGLPSCGSTSSGNFKGMWYKATPTANGSMTIASCGSSFDTYLRVYSGGSCGNFTTCEASDDDGCATQSTVTITAVAGTTYYILLGGYDNTSAGTFTLTASGVPLPVTMDKLSGQTKSDNRAQLSWNTFTEENNRGFEIQRSADGKIFTKTDFIASKAPRGNSKEKIAYTYTDPVMLSGAAYYRLQQTDADGKTAYSNIVRLNSSDENIFSITATPNPVSSKLQVKVSGGQNGNAQLLITDISGKVIQHMVTIGGNTEVDMSAVTRGIYLLKYTSNDRTQTIKIIKQ